VIVIIIDKMQPNNAVSCISCYSYSTWKLLAWWLYIQSELSSRCSHCVCVSFCAVCWELLQNTDNLRCARFCRSIIIIDIENKMW